MAAAPARCISVWTPAHEGSSTGALCRRSGSRLCSASPRRTAGDDLFTQDLGVAVVLRELAEDLQFERPNGTCSSPGDDFVAPEAVGAGNSIVALTCGDTARTARPPIIVLAPSGAPLYPRRRLASHHVGSNRRRGPVAAIPLPTIERRRKPPSTSTNTPTRPTVGRARQRGSAPAFSLLTFELRICPSREHHRLALAGNRGLIPGGVSWL